MKPTHASLSLYLRDLETTYAGTAGRRLVRELDELGLSTLGVSQPLELAQFLQAAHPSTDQLVAQLAELAATRSDLLSLLIVALTPEITAAITRSGGRWLTVERYGDLCLGAKRALSEEWVSREDLADRIVSEARKESRSEIRHQVPTISWPEGFDVVDESSLTPDTDPRLEILNEALGHVAISMDDYVVMVETRSQGNSLAWFAEYYGISYSAARMRRARAEAKFREYITREVNR